jgi:signal transduction histidine kinase
MIRVLASVGAQLAAFVHEINGLLDIANAVEATVTKLRNSIGLSAEHKRTLAALQRSSGDLKRSLERQASYLVDVVSPDARRRRSRQPFAEQFDAGARLVAFAAERRRIKIQNQIPSGLRSPPMFRSELTAIFANLLTNAVKAAGAKGRIRATGKESKDSYLIRIENTGVRVSLRDAERWFKPFESTTARIDPILGQGMGLGLTITRSIIEEYGGKIKFVAPSPSFATALEIVLPG